jgi:adenylyl-sulfate kinase
MKKENLKRSSNIIWLMGPTSSGKTTIAETLLFELRKQGQKAIHFDGDEVRDYFGKDFGFSSSNRLMVIKTIVSLAKKTSEAGITTIVSALTAHDEARIYIQANCNNLFVIFVECSIKECARRDPKGLYKKAESGEIDTLIGYNSKYQPPENPEIIVKTEFASVGSCVQQILIKGKEILYCE